ncbi:MAG: DUF6878 family protein [Sphingomonadaceae bacterium]
MSTNPDFAAVQESWQERETARKRLAEKIFPLNKAVLFSALRDARITELTVGYDGSGDEGRIDNIVACAGSEIVDVPGIIVDLSYADETGGGAKSRRTDLNGAIGDFAEELIYRLYPWWEDNDGAYGEVTFDVAAETVTLDHNARFTAVNSFQHDF